MHVAKTKVLRDQLPAARLQVFEYAKSRFSYDAAHIMCLSDLESASFCIAVFFKCYNIVLFCTYMHGHSVFGIKKMLFSW